MQYQGGIFQTAITIANAHHTSDAEWKRNVDLCMFRFPTRRKDGSYDLNLPEFCGKIMNSLNARGWCVAFAYGSIENKLRPFVLAAEMVKAGFQLVDIIIASRPWWGGKRSDTHLALSHEYIFLFSKAATWHLDRTPVYPLLEGAKYEEASCPGNSWDLKWNLKSFNPAENYSADVAAAIMKMVCLLPGSVILDPIMGGSSGLDAALECGHSFIGYEPDEEKYAKYSKIIKKAHKLIKERDGEHGRSE